MNSNPCSLCACACACACGVHVCMCACACACVRVCVTTARENRQCLLTVMVMTTNTTPSSVPLALYLCRVVVFISGLGSAIGYGMSAGATTAAMLIASRIPVGLAKQTVTVSRAILADCTPVEKRTGMLHCSTHCAARHSKVTPKPNVDPHLPLSSRTFSVGLPVYMLKSADRDNPLTHGRDVNPRTHIHTYARAHARARFISGATDNRHHDAVNGGHRCRVCRWPHSRSKVGVCVRRDCPSSDSSIRLFMFGSGHVFLFARDSPKAACRRCQKGEGRRWHEQ